MEESIQYLIDDPSCDTGSTDCRHFFRPGGMSVFIHVWLEPGRNDSPFLSDVER